MSKIAFEGVKKMSEALTEAQNLLRDYISPPIAGGSVKERIYRAARYVGFTFSRTHTLWYGNARRVDAQEIDLLRAAAVKKATSITVETTNGNDFWGTVTELRAQITELRSHIERLDKMAQNGR